MKVRYVGKRPRRLVFRDPETGEKIVLTINPGDEIDIPIERLPRDFVPVSEETAQHFKDLIKAIVMGRHKSGKEIRDILKRLLDEVGVCR